MNKRYQVFVSSTFVDLKDERQKVLQTLMEMDCIPAGMELFPAADEEQWEFIKKVIDDCDYYLLIIGGGYGSIADDGISYTEKEFDYAVSKNIKVIALLHNEPDSLPREKTELDPNNYAKLIQFKNKVRNGRLVRFWESSSQLPGEVALSLNKTIKMYPAICVSDLADFDSKVTLNGTFILNKMSMYLDTEHLSWTTEITWSDLYALVSPFISDKPRESKVSEFIAEHISSVDKNRSGLSDLVLNQQDLFTIRIQLLALGLIDVDTSIPDKTMWSLTEQGIFKMIQSRIIKK
ncbi:DUF4062 domain-containing protein [Aeromonas veronii]|uniref:DUF4062 domain-containing protein n=1 Tax=Aeromonas veronii TaxID=654 RepID=UPI0038B572C8